MDDFLGDLLNVGAERGGWRSPWAILGSWLGYAGGGIATGGCLGWVGFVMLTDLIHLALLFLVFFAIAAAWIWLTGGA